MNPQTKIEQFRFVRKHANDLAIGNAILDLFEAADPNNDAPEVSIANAMMYLVGDSATASEPEPVKPKLWTDHPRVKKAAKAQAKHRTGKRGGNMGEPRICVKCGETKGITAFPSGSDTCRKCGKTSTGRPAKKQTRGQMGSLGVLKPNTPAPSNGKRVCMVCDTPKGLDKYDGEARVCRVCEDSGINGGEIN